MALTTVQSGMLNADSQNYGFKNRIINGAMVIDQRNAGASVTLDNSGNTYPADRWGGIKSVAGGGTITGQQVSDAPTGFRSSIKITTTSAATVSGSDYVRLQHRIEGYNVADLGLGTVSASTFTLSFWVKSSLIGTFGGAFGNDAWNRSYPFTYTINNPNTWEQKTITVVGDTAGTWQTTNLIGLAVYFGLGVGSTYSGTAGSWSSNLYISATGATSVIGTLNATWQVTGVQLEKGSVATEFDRRPYGTELALCQRYFETGYGLSEAPANGASSYFFGGSLGAWAYTTNNMRSTVVPFSVTKRAQASITLYNTGVSGISANQWAYYTAGGAWANYSDASNAVVSRTGFNVRSTSTSTSGSSYMIEGNWAASAEL